MKTTGPKNMTKGLKEDLTMIVPAVVVMIAAAIVGFGFHSKICFWLLGIGAIWAAGCCAVQIVRCKLPE
jgi:hypothetical protein